MENDLISRAALLDTLLNHFGQDLTYLGEDLQYCQEAVQFAPTIEPEPVRHGRWVHEIHDFYRESMCDDYCLTVYILAKCSECGEKHRESGQEYLQDFIGEEDGERPVENVAEKIDLARRNYLAGLRRGRYKLKNYCHNCGAKMDGGAEG